MPIDSSKAKSFKAKPKKTSDNKRETQQKRKAKTNVPTASKTEKERESSTLDRVVSHLEKFLVDRLWDYFPQPVQFILQTVKSYFPRIAFIATIVFFIAWNFFVRANIGHRVAIHSLKPNLKHATYERTAEVDRLVNDLDRLRKQNPKKEIHVIISGGPGAGKSELARQLGERIYYKENYIYNVYWFTLDLSFLFPPKDVVTLNAENLQLLQRSLEEALGKVQGKEPTDVRHQSEVNEERIFIKFHQLRVAFRNRSSIWNDPVVIFDNVKTRMFSFLYKRRDHGKFFLQPGNDEYGEIRVIVTTQYRPTTNFSSLISYMNLFDPMPVNESVNLLNTVSNIQNDDKNASYLAEALGGLPKALADAAIYIQADRRFNSSYYFYLKELELNMKKYEHKVNFTWATGVEEGLSYNLTTFTASLMLIQQLISHSSYDHFYLDLACFIGYSGSPVISMKFLENYVQFNDALKDYTETQIKILVRKTSIYEVKTDYGKYSLILTHQITRYTSLIGCNERIENNETIEASIARIFHVLKSELTTNPEPSLNQMVEYTSLDFTVVDVVMSLVSNIYKQRINISNIVTKEFCWVFLDSMAEASLYWPNNHKSAIIMPEVEFLVNMTEQSFSEQNPEVALLLSVLYLHYTGNQRPENLLRIVDMIENFIRSSLSDVDEISIEKMALLINMIGTVYRGVAQNMSKAQEFHELALDISQRYNSTNEIAISLHLLGIIHRYQRNLDTARRYHEDAVELGRKIFPPKNNGRLAAFLLNLAVVYNRLGQLEEARLMYQETLELTRKEYGSRDQRVGRVLNTLATNYYALGKYNESIEALLEALSIHEETHGDYHPNVGQTLFFLGFTYRAKGELQNSLQVLSRSLKIFQQYYGDQHYHVAEVLHDLSNTQRELNLLDDALQNAERCVEIFRNTLKESSSDFATSLNGLGHIYFALGDPNTAKMKYEKALEIFEKLQEHGFQGVGISETLKNIAVALKNLEETDKAKEYISRSLSIILNVYPESHPRVKELRRLSKELEQMDGESEMESQKEL